ncbi:AAA family ATPase [Fulvivirga ulvae]|uniref:AAA family ATPase n=1 Tax=Fulvivirga ulvae TaxID=2904245 RepID=UPI001F48498A|nr:AAA family ATPase [Fulvivirga ulvae]UII32827.1 AAA family ATPase [Fulvivirga ulvae]
MSVNGTIKGVNGTAHHPIRLSALQEEIQELEKTLKVSEKREEVFTVKTMNQYMKDASQKPMPKMLLSELWFEGEICFLFADTNLGKSAISVQIADSITKGEAIPGFKLEVGPQKVLLFDFELSDKQVEIRYSNRGNNHYKFSDLLLRVEPNGKALLNEDTYIENGKAMLEEIEQLIISHGAKIVIVDNLTYLQDTLEKSKGVLALMKRLKALKEMHGYTFLILAHTPKRDCSRPIEKKDLFGSSALMNFADSAIAVGESTQSEYVRYIKQVKQRNCEKIYGSDNVIVGELVKNDNCMIFQFLNYGSEYEHLRVKTQKEKEELDLQIITCHEEDESRSFRDIARQFKVHPMRVKRTLQKMKNGNGA